MNETDPSRDPGAPPHEEAGHDAPLDAPEAGFQTDDLGEQVFALRERVSRVFAVVGGWLGWLVWPLELLVHLPQILTEAGIVHAPGRRHRNLLFALPAVACLFGGVGVAVAGFVERWGLADEYRAAAREALERRDDEAARVYFGREFDLDGTPDALLGLARAYERRGDLAKAEPLMRRAADEFGEGSAQLWLADRLLADPAALADRGRVEEAVRRLRAAETGGASRDEVAPRMARALAAGGDLAGAVPYLDRAAEHDPAMRLDLAAAYARLGRTEQARAAAAAAEAEFRRRVEADPGDVVARVRWVTCLLNVGRPQEAIEAIDAAGIEGGRAPVLDELLALACLARERELAAAGGAAKARLDLLRRALEARPRSEAALLRLIAFADDPAAGDAAVDAARLRDEALAGGNLPAGVSIALGQRAWNAGDGDTAVRHLEQAHAADPSNLVAANNLAWLLAHAPKPDLGRALSIADDLVTQRPDVAHFRDTRGQVLAKLGRWNEAIADLEQALVAMKDSVETRRTLAEAYRQVGRQRLAELQDREADRIEAGKKSGKAAGAAEPPAKPGG